MITLGVIGILLGILLPVLLRSRGQTLEVVSLSNTREVCRTLLTYPMSNRDQFPFPPKDDSDPNDILFGPIVWTPTGEIGSDSVLHYYGDRSFFFIAEYWPALVRDVAPWPEHYKTWLSPGHPTLADANDTRPLWARTGSIGRISYHYSTAFMVSPRLLTENAPADWSLLQPTRTSMVAYPAAKVLAFDSDRSYLPSDGTGADKWPTGFADGSASLRDRTKAMVIRNPLGGGGRYHDTPGGVTGRDF